jgi:hypothetical protein
LSQQEQNQQQVSTTDNIDNPVKDELDQTIKEEQQKEVSYILEATQADQKISKYLAKKSEYKIIFDDGKELTFKRKPLSSKKNREIDDLRTAYTANRLNPNKPITINGQEFKDANEALYEAFVKTAEYCLGLTRKQYDSAIWEDFPEYMDNDIYGLRSIIAACLLRAVHGVAYFPQLSKNG